MTEVIFSDQLFFADELKQSLYLVFENLWCISVGFNNPPYIYHQERQLLFIRLLSCFMSSHSDGFFHQHQHSRTVSSRPLLRLQQSLAGVIFTGHRIMYY